MKNIAIITGASSGIGRDIARVTDKRELFLDEIWLIGRNPGALGQLADFLDTPAKVFVADLTVPAVREQLRETVATENIRIQLLVNAAGLGFDGLTETQESADIMRMIRTNVEALTEMTHLCLPKMNAGCRILNIASAAAFLPQPYFNVYAATKSYVMSFSRALHYELKDVGIIVTASCPGPVDTAFFDNMSKGVQTGVKWFPKAKSLTVALEAYNENFRGRAVCTHSLSMKVFRGMCKVLPHGLILKGYNVLIHARNYCR